MNDFVHAYQHQMQQAADAMRAQAAATGAPAWPYGPAHWHLGYQHVPYAALHAGPPAAPAPAGLLNDRFLKGLLIGAAAAYLLGNESVQRTAIKSAVRAWGLVQGGVEELKERFHDAEAEVRAETAE